MAPPTVRDLMDQRGKHQFAMLRVETLDEAEAAAKAGVELNVDTAPGKGCTISVTVTESREPIASHP